MAQRCTAKAKSTGEQCARYAIEGGTTCRVHGSGSARAKEAAARRVAEVRAAQAVQADAHAVLAHASLVPLVDPVDALARLASEASAWKDALAARVNALNAIRYGSDVSTEQLRAEVALYERAMDRTARLCETLAKLGLDERRVRINEDVARVFVDVLTVAFDAAGVTAEQAAAGREAAARRLELIEGGAA